jgi:hypothetical protein
MYNMKKQTAVEWLVSEYAKAFKISVNAVMGETIEKAIAMEKELMIDAHIEGQRVFDNYQHTQWTTDQAEQYYKETYGGEK